jgi:hypothetical protein
MDEVKRRGGHGVRVRIFQEIGFDAYTHAQTR